MSEKSSSRACTGLGDKALAQQIELLLMDCAPADWVAYQCDELTTKEACTVGHFGDWVVGSESNHPGGNFRDDDTGNDEEHAKLIALVKNHAPQIVKALRAAHGISEADRRADEAETAHEKWVQHGLAILDRSNKLTAAVRPFVLETHEQADGPTLVRCCLCRKYLPHKPDCPLEAPK